jgi:hypothetical protein
VSFNPGIEPPHTPRSIPDLDEFEQVSFPQAIGACCARRTCGGRMLHRRFFLHYRLVRESLTAIAAITGAAFLSYLILQARF